MAKEKGKRGPPKGFRKPVEPSEEFKALHSRAAEAFIEGDVDRAEELAKETVRLNPEIFIAHSLLSEIHSAQGDMGRAITALFHAVHTRPRDVETWLKVADMVMESVGDERAPAIADAIYCLNRVIGVEPTHVQGRYQRAALNREIGYNGKARYDYLKLLKQLPHDLTALRHLAEVCIDLKQSPKAIAYYDASILHYKSLEPHTVATMNWSDINIYGELFMHSEDLSGFTEGLVKLKRVSRWVLGRGDEEFWDNYTDDDREFDVDDEPRRIEVQNFVPGNFRTVAYGKNLPLELRVKMGIYRLKLGTVHHREALVRIMEPGTFAPAEVNHSLILSGWSPKIMDSTASCSTTQTSFEKLQTLFLHTACIPKHFGFMSLCRRWKSLVMPLISTESLPAIPH